jgi:hypothetical protein
MRKLIYLAFVFSIFLSCSGPSGNNLIDVKKIKEEQKRQDEIAKKRVYFSDDSGTTETAPSENK